MAIKKQLVTYLSIPLIMYGGHSAAQQVQDSFKDKHDRDAVEILEDKLGHGIESLEDAAQWVWEYIKLGAEWAVSKYQEESMERQVESRLTVNIDDPALLTYLRGEGVDFDLSAELIGISKDKTLAAFDVKTDLSIDDAVLHRQYEFRIVGYSVETISRVGKTWVQRYDKEITLDEFSKIARLYIAVEGEQQRRTQLMKQEIPNADVEYKYDARAFKGLQSIANTDYNQNDNPVIFSLDMYKAQVGMSYVVRDIFENPVDSVTHFQVDEYARDSTGWTYTRTLLSAMYANDILIGAENNPFEKEKSALTNFKEKAGEFFDKMF